MEESKDNKGGAIKYFVSLMLLFIVLLFGAVGYLYSKCAKQEEMFANAINNSRKVYVYDFEEAFTRLGVHEKKQRFQDDIVELNKELTEGEKKIKNIKQAKLKADYADTYLNSLRLKRDNLVSEYQNSVNELDKDIKMTLVEIAKEKDVSAVFLKSAIAIKTPQVIDLTEEVVDRVKKKQKEN